MFELLAKSQPTTVNHLNKLTSFFEHIYIRARRRLGRAATLGPAVFLVETWNQLTTNRVQWHSSHHQQHRGVASRAAGTVPVSPPNRVDLHEWHSARHPASEITVSAGYDSSKSPVC